MVGSGSATYSWFWAGSYAFTSRMAQWLACWAHNPKVPGSKPGSAIALHATCSIQTRGGVFVWAMPFRTAYHFQRPPTWSRAWCPYHLSYEMWIARGVAQFLAWILGKWRSARSVTVSYKPPILVTRVRLPSCAAAMTVYALLAFWAPARRVS